MTAATDPLAWGKEVADFLQENWIEDIPEGLEAFVQIYLLDEFLTGRNKEETGYAYRNYFELVRRHGTLRKQALIIPDNPILEAMELGECYWNSYTAAVELGYQYVEGYACTNNMMIVPHAWFEDDEGTIIDPTWAQLDLEPNFQITYFGVKFSTEFVIDRTDVTAHCAVLGSDWMVHAPIIKRGLVFEGDIAVGLGPDAQL